MSFQNRTYLMVLAVPAYRIDDKHFAVESAFADHLRLLRSKLGLLGNNIVLAGPTLSEQTFARTRALLTVIDEEAEGIRFAGMFPVDTGRVGYMKDLPNVLRSLFNEVQQAAVVHSGPSALYRPFEFPSLLMGRALGKKTISITDIDNRCSVKMNYRTGRWSKKEYLITRLFHTPYTHLQHLVCARTCSLVLLKGVKMAKDYGNGRSNVKDFLDAAFSASHIIPPARLEEKLAQLAIPNTPIDITYFGRLVAYKGIDHMLRALAHAKRLGLRDVRFHIVGEGAAEADLKALAIELDIGDQVVFHGAVAFGDGLFAQLYDYHLLLAAPLSEDTPRSALDAMASGQALLAYDSYYYKELATAGGAVELVPWPDHTAMGQRLFDLCRDRSRLADLICKGVNFAHKNTQEIWLDRRVQWTKELFAGVT